MAQVSVPQPPQSMGDYALEYALRGIPVFPIKARDKHPLTEHGFKDATTDAEQIRQWWRKWRNANIGIPTGPRSGWLVVDIDTKAGATYDTLAALGHLPATMTAQTGSGGLHLVFRYPRNSLEVRNSASKVAQGIDVRGDGGYIVAAPSIHPSGGAYEWVKELEPTPCPSWLLTLMTEQPARPNIELLATRKTTADSDDRDAYWLAWALAGRPGKGTDDMGNELAKQLLLDPNVRNVDAVLAEYAQRATLDTSHPFTERDIDRWLKSAQGSRMVTGGEPAKKPRAQTARPLPPKRERPKLHAVPPISEEEPPTQEEQPAARRSYHRTELGNAERLLDAYGAQLRYTKAMGYVAWDGKRWLPGAELSVEHWAKAVIRDLYREAAELAGGAADASGDGEREQIANEAQELMKWAISSEKAKMVTAMLMLARSACAVDIDQFDREPWLFNCQNGTIDLRTGELRAHRREDYLMQIGSVAYDPTATCPRWERFIREIMLDDMEMVAYLQRALGYALSGDTSPQEWYLMVGEGENGKTVLMETIAAIFGEYAHMMLPETITMTGQPRRGQDASPDIAILKGKRFVRVTETQEGARIDASRIKSLSGSDEQTARFHYKGFFTFRPTAKMFIYTNHKPESRETAHAFWRRVRYIPFDLNLREHPERKDAQLPEKLRAELPGILAWLVRGCLAWQRDGLNPPQRVLEATEAYRAESDVLADFLSTYCVLGSDYEVRASVLYDKYVKWCQETGERQHNMRRFGKALTERGIQRRTNNGIIYVGIGIRHDGEMM